MSLHRYAKTRDRNEAEIVAELRAHPDVALVYLMDQPCDLLVQLEDGSWHLLEVKNIERGEARRKPDPRNSQARFWKIAKPPPPIVATPFEAFRALGLRICEPPHSIDCTDGEL